MSSSFMSAGTGWGVCPGGSFFCKKRFDRTGKVLI